MATEEPDLDAETQLAADLMDKGGLRLELARLSADRFGHVVHAFEAAGIENAVDADGALVVAVPPPQAMPELRAGLGAAKEEFERAVRLRLAQRKHQVYDLGDLTSAQVNQVLDEAATAGIHTAFDRGELVVGRRDSVAVEKLIDDVIAAGEAGGGAARPGSAAMAGWAVRIMGGLVDVAVALLLLTGALIGLAPVMTETNAASVGFVVIGMYHAVLTARTGRTLGKLMNDTKVIDTKSGELPTPRQSLLRSSHWFLAAAVPSAFISAVIIGTYSTILSTKRRQGIHDVLAKTSVIVIPREPSAGRQGDDVQST